ncbi:MAG TPA: homoserine dehydrogenase [Bacteroidia bacterium]|jgi:homoserine dehydrogenase|nr:homoserine dehydrogenase [Bacteroidia bacterium]
MSEKEISIGLFGFGCVGQGLYDVLNHSQSLKAKIEKICVKDRLKKRKIDSSYFTYNKEDLLNAENLDVIVELIDDAEEAFRIVSEALNKKVNVVTANKKMLAENFEALYRLQEKNNVALIYEGSAGGSIPIIRNLEEYYDNELLGSFRGILNGTCNYILSRMELESKGYDEILKDAQSNGFAESNPWLDVAGFDTLYKTILLTVHSFGLILSPAQVLNLGIQNITFDDIVYAREKGLRIKLLGTGYKSGNGFRVYVMPHFVEKTDELYNVIYEYNGVEVEGAFSCKQTFVGKGAGSHPTGSAVLSDISALTYNYRYAYKKLKKLSNGKGKLANGELLDTDFSIRVYIRFKDKEELRGLDILNIEEEYKSAHTNYIVASVTLKSLFVLKGNAESKVFVCCI